jgi:hypothetical protein
MTVAECARSAVAVLVAAGAAREDETFSNSNVTTFTALAKQRTASRSSYAA